MDFEVFNFIYNIHLTARVSRSLMDTEMFYWIFTANMLLVYKKVLISFLSLFLITFYTFILQKYN